MSVNISQIHYTRDYEIFKFFPQNRKIYQKHVRSFILDETFSKNFSSCPIVVNSEMRILDGQHRFEAAKQLDIGIYYLTCHSGNLEDMVRRNVTQKSWKMVDYVEFYQKSNNHEYDKFDQIRLQTGMSFSHGMQILALFHEMRGSDYAKKFKTGHIELYKYLEEYTEFTGIVFSLFKHLSDIRGKSYVHPLLQKSYIHVLFDMYKNERKRFDKLILKMNQSCVEYPYCGTQEQAAKALKAVFMWRKPPSVYNKDDSE